MDWLGLWDEADRLLFDKDALHIYAALLIQIVAAKLSRRSLGHPLPWLAVLAAETINEIADIARGGEPGLMAWQIVGGVHDFVNTMILPTVLLLLCRRAPDLFAWPAAQPNGATGERPAPTTTAPDGAGTSSPRA